MYDIFSKIKDYWLKSKYLPENKKDKYAQILEMRYISLNSPTQYFYLDFHSEKLI